jgi:hypothetical protein
MPEIKIIDGDWGRRGKTRAPTERAWFFAEGEKSKEGASERVFLAGKNERVLTRMPLARLR